MLRSAGMLTCALVAVITGNLFSASGVLAQTPSPTPTPVSKVQDPNTRFFGVFWCPEYEPGTPIADCRNVRDALDDKNGDGNPNDPWPGWDPARKNLIEGAAATKANLATAFNNLADGNAGNGELVPGDELVVFTTSHGACGEADDNVNGNHGNEANDEPDASDEVIFDNASATITDDELSDMLSIFPKSVTITVIVQACHAGGFGDGKADLLDIRDKNGNHLAPGHAEILMSCRVDENSGGPPPPDPTFYFGNAVRDCLKQKGATGKTVADADFGNNDGVTTSKELFACAKTKTEQQTTTQHPQYVELGAVGGIAELPSVAQVSAHRRGWSVGEYAALAGGGAAAAVVLGAGAWYVRRRWLR